MLLQYPAKVDTWKLHIFTYMLCFFDNKHTKKYFTCKMIDYIHQKRSRQGTKYPANKYICTQHSLSLSCCHAVLSKMMFACLKYFSSLLP